MFTTLFYGVFSHERYTCKLDHLGVYISKGKITDNVIISAFNAPSGLSTKYKIDLIWQCYDKFCSQYKNRQIHLNVNSWTIKKELK